MIGGTPTGQEALLAAHIARQTEEIEIPVLGGDDCPAYPVGAFVSCIVCPGPSVSNLKSSR